MIKFEPKLIHCLPQERSVNVSDSGTRQMSPCIYEKITVRLWLIRKAPKIRQTISAAIRGEPQIIFTSIRAMNVH